MLRSACIVGISNFIVKEYYKKLQRVLANAMRMALNAM